MRSKISVLLLVVLLSTIANKVAAQCPLTLSELEKLCTYNAADFENKIYKKGYAVNEGLQNIPAPDIKICFCRKYISQKAKDKVDRGTDPGGTPVITYYTTDKKHYQSIKADLEKKKYKFAQELPFSVNNIPTTQFIYTDKKHALSLISFVDKDQIPWYAVMIHK